MAQLMILLMSRVYISNSVFISGGALVALVAISSCANHVNYWAAFLIGCLAGKKLYIFSRIRMFQNVLIHTVFLILLHTPVKLCSNMALGEGGVSLP